MKAALVYWFALLLSATALGEEQSTPRVSIAEVGSVRLEVEQPDLQGKLLVRVRDFAAANQSLQEVFCDVYYVSDSGTEHKADSVVLHVSSPMTYTGVYTDSREFFAHGAVAKVVYKSHGLKLPISTWYAFYFH